jgi:hypothetical protein
LKIRIFGVLISLVEFSGCYKHTPSPPAAAEPPKKMSKTTKTPKLDGGIKIISLSSTNPDKTVKIGASLDEK